MRVGVPGFNGHRLILARDARNVTQIGLAEMIGRRSNTAISRWSPDHQKTDAVTLDVVARALNVPPAYFLRQTPTHGEAPLFFRSISAMTKTARERAKARLRWAQDITLSLQEWVTLPLCKVPSEFADDFRRIETSEIEKAAQSLRRSWALRDGPIPDLHLLMENNGIVIVHDVVGTATMDGLSNWSTADERGYVYLATDKPSAVRLRLNAAHELAHLVLHRNVNVQSFERALEFKEIERQAFEFAGAFLMPAQTFGAEIPYTPTLDSLLALKARWGVSVGAMIKRCETLGLVSPNYVERMWRHYGARGWRTKEPLDDTIAAERPRLLARAVEAVSSPTAAGLAALNAALPLNASDVEVLCGLEHGRLSQVQLEDFPLNNVLAFRPRTS